MKNKQLYKKLAKLESINDILVTEIEHIDELMKDLGFVHGIVSLKETAEDLITKGYIHN